MDHNEQSPSSSIVYYGPDVPTGRGPTAHVSAFTSGGMMIHFRAGLGELSATTHLTADGCLALADELVAGAASLGVVQQADDEAPKLLRLHLQFMTMKNDTDDVLFYEGGARHSLKERTRTYLSRAARR